MDFRGLVVRDSKYFKEKHSAKRPLLAISSFWFAKILGLYKSFGSKKSGGAFIRRNNIDRLKQTKQEKKLQMLPFTEVMVSATDKET